LTDEQFITYFAGSEINKIRNGMKNIKYQEVPENYEKIKELEINKG
jgi:hypothetical protein